jgi:succinate dehydrogenase/fumarate reductase flavoprotein subunit
MDNNIEIPQIISPEDVTSWEKEVDVIVVGQGVAGTCAALEAYKAGAEVLIVERASGGGGASAMSSGIFYLGGGTEVQKAAGYEDTAEEMAAFMMSCCDPLDSNAALAFCRDSKDHFDWLEARGVPFERTYHGEKAVWLADTTCLMWTGNEKAWPFREAAKPAPRGHKVAGMGENAGAEGMKPLLARCSEQGIPAIYDSAVVGLVQGSDKRVAGVKVKQPGKTFFVKARRGVIIACGSHNMSQPLIKKYLPLLGETSEPLGIPSNDGMGVRLGISAGANPVNMDGVIPTASIYPPGKLIKGIVVNANGERFVAEDVYHGRLANFIMEQPGQKAYLIVDEEIFAYPEITHARHTLIDGFETVEAMEAALKLPQGSLVRTLNEYNEGAEKGEDKRFHKHVDWLKPLGKGSWAAFDISFNKSTYVFITLGGIRADERGRALDLYSQPIPGLYVVGASAAHIPKSGKAYGSGMSLGPGSYFGRRAGRDAAGAAWEEQKA